MEEALRRVAANSAADAFYSLMYIGLWREARGEEDAAKAAMKAAVQTPYGQRSGDYMASLAVVHCKRRGWAAAGRLAA